MADSGPKTYEVPSDAVSPAVTDPRAPLPPVNVPKLNDIVQSSSSSFSRPLPSNLVPSTFPSAPNPMPNFPAPPLPSAFPEIPSGALGLSSSPFAFPPQSAALSSNSFMNLPSAYPPFSNLAPFPPLPTNSMLPSYTPYPGPTLPSTPAYQAAQPTTSFSFGPSLALNPPPMPMAPAYTPPAYPAPPIAPSPFDLFPPLQPASPSYFPFSSSPLSPTPAPYLPFPQSLPPASSFPTFPTSPFFPSPLPFGASLPLSFSAPFSTNLPYSPFPPSFSSMPVALPPGQTLAPSMYTSNYSTVSPLSTFTNSANYQPIPATIFSQVPSLSRPPAILPPETATYNFQSFSAPVIAPALPAPASFTRAPPGLPAPYPLSSSGPTVILPPAASTSATYVPSFGPSFGLPPSPTFGLAMPPLSAPAPTLHIPPSAVSYPETTFPPSTFNPLSTLPTFPTRLETLPAAPALFGVPPPFPSFGALAAAGQLGSTTQFFPPSDVPPPTDVMMATGPSTKLSIASEGRHSPAVPSPPPSGALAPPADSVPSENLEEKRLKASLGAELDQVLLQEAQRLEMHRKQKMEKQALAVGTPEQRSNWEAEIQVREEQLKKEWEGLMQRQHDFVTWESEVREEIKKQTIDLGAPGSPTFQSGKIKVKTIEEAEALDAKDGTIDGKFYDTEIEIEGIGLYLPPYHMMGKKVTPA